MTKFDGVRISGTFVLLLLAIVLTSCASTAAPSTDAIASSATALPTPSSSATVVAEPPSPSPATNEGPTDGWVEVASFGDDESIETVHAVVETPFGLLAAGVHIPGRSLPVFGPIKQDGRIWLSANGQDWEDVTPSGTFADADVYQLIALPDGAVVAFARLSQIVNGNPEELSEAWETSDGRTWVPADINAGGAPMLRVVAGGKGFLTILGVPLGEQGLWHSSDGRTYSPVPNDEFNSQRVTSVAAGPEGFVVFTSAFETTAPPILYASGDGMQWYEATSLPNWEAGAAGAAGLASDWIAVGSRPFDEEWTDIEVPTWHSANGLDWTAVGQVPLRAIPVGESGTCAEFPSLLSTGSLAVVTTGLSYPCAEGRVQRFGAAHISADGITWSPLPFAAEATLDDDTRGTYVGAGVDLDSGTLLVGEMDYGATFWLRPSD